MPLPASLRAALHHPTLNLLVALVLVGTSVVQIWESLAGEVLTMGIGGMRMDVGVQQGVLVYGVVHLLRAVAELVENLERRRQT
jgi:hypothetical protein